MFSGKRSREPKRVKWKRRFHSMGPSPAISRSKRRNPRQNTFPSLPRQSFSVILSLLFLFGLVAGGLTGCTSTIQKIRTTDEVSKLRDHLEHDKSWMREEAALRLGELKAVKATPQLLQLLDDPAPWVREAAARALRMIDDPRAVEPLVEKLKTEENVDVQCAIMMTLGALGDHDAVPVLRKKRKHENLLIKGCAKFAEKKIRQ